MSDATASAADPNVGQAPVAPPVAGRKLWRRVLRNPIGLLTSVLLLLIVAFGLLAPWLAPFDPNLARLELTNAGPFSGDFLLGGDNTGRDILSRLMFATRGTLEAILVVLVVSSVLGGTTGLIAGYYGGRLDDAADWISNVLLALPGIVLLIVLYTVIGPNILVAMAVYGVLVSPSYFRLVRSLVQNIRHELYIDAAKVAGLSDLRIVSRHVLRAVRGPIIVHSAFILASGIAVQAALEFLGLGDPTEPSWGRMLQDAFNNIFVNRAAVIWPVLLIGITTLSLVLLGNVIRDALQQSANRPTALAPSVVKRLRAEQASAHPSPSVPAQGEDVPLLRVRDLAMGYPNSSSTVTTVVHGVDLVVERGEIHGLVGESGSGKSQVALSILGILPPEAVILRGAIEFHGEDLLADPKRMRQVRAPHRLRAAGADEQPGSHLHDRAAALLRSAGGQGHLPARGQAAAAGAPGPRGDQEPRPCLRSLPPPGVGRDGAAGPDRRRAGRRPRADHRGRADNGPRCDGAGRRPRPAAQPPAGTRPRHGDRDAQLRSGGRPL